MSIKLPSGPTFSPNRLIPDITEWARKVAYAINNIHYGYDDLRFPAVGINLPGGAADPTRDNTTGLLVFSQTLDNVIAGVSQMPHSWGRARYPIVKPHIHLRVNTATTAVSRWQFEYDVASVNDNFANALGTYTSLPAVSFTNPNSTTKHAILSLGDLDLTGNRESCVILWRVWRLASSDAADVDTSTINLLEFDIHYVHDKPGTPTEHPI